MSLHVDIKFQIASAMRAKEPVRLSVLRGLATAFMNELVAKGRKPQEELADEEAMAVIKRAVKQRQDSIEQYEKGGRKDLADEERAELGILETFLPTKMSKEEIRKIAETKKTELGVTDKSKSGILVGAVIKETKSVADGKDVKEVVESLFE
ncbi:MAG: GatB/YqeY domain-containing protein [bacterium]|nr:GatB/YqeY domain-containing protein [bacterium]